MLWTRPCLPSTLPQLSAPPAPRHTRQTPQGMKVLQGKAHSRATRQTRAKAAASADPERRKGRGLRRNVHPTRPPCGSVPFARAAGRPGAQSQAPLEASPAGPGPRGVGPPGSAEQPAGPGPTLRPGLLQTGLRPAPLPVAAGQGQRRRGRCAPLSRGHWEPPLPCSALSPRTHMADRPGSTLTHGLAGTAANGNLVGF